MKTFRYAICVVVCALCVQAQDWLPKHVVLRVDKQRAQDGTPLLVPMIAPKLGYQVVAGPPVKPGDVLECEPFNKPMGGSAVALMLKCKDRTLCVLGVEF